MFKSSVSVKSLFDMVDAEVDIRVAITDENMLFWYNSLIRSLYLDIIKSVKHEKKIVDENRSLNVSDGVECIKRIVFEGLPELEKASVLFASSTERPVWYEKDATTVVVLNVGKASECSVYSYEIPESADIKNAASVFVPLPDNFVELAKYRLLAEMYNAANDDILSAKYFGFYNARLDDFRLWVIQNSSSLN